MAQNSSSIPTVDVDKRQPPTKLIGTFTAWNSKEKVFELEPSKRWAHLPSYKAPQTPLFRITPTALIPYAELMRLHKPAGYYAFFFPHLTGTLLAASCGPVTPTPQALARIILSHAIAVLFLRGAACSYNDALDGPFDRLVERCRHRPVARGAVSPFTAHLFAAAQAVIWVAILPTFPRQTTNAFIWLSCTMLLYPWCKRFTNYPQVVLGLSLALGQGIGTGAVCWDVFAEQYGWKLIGVVALYLSAVLNAVVYDTVYAYQDLNDDLKAGIMSMAIACMGRTKQWLGLLSFFEVVLLATAGYAMGFQGAYWLMTVGGTAAVLARMLSTWEIEDPADCFYWFCHLIWYTGSTICGGLAGEYIQKLLTAV
ncbi:UbiA prenyltransferase family-domain-containing protein [Phaeosphaeria sp. MPI-PUGE-AT-0046c]|nr:UbiA prenyltransferase family-domain-containing protein [Phaeosphaeria sp. MPI-PUGE-AT-0046c]